MAKAKQKLNKTQRRRAREKEKATDKKHYRILLGLMAFGACYYVFVAPRTIVQDGRYALYIVVLPILLGMIAIGWYRKQFLLKQFKENRSWVLTVFMIVFYGAQGILFSYLSFGQVAKMSWDFINYQITKQQPTAISFCPITKFGTKKNTLNSSSSISFNPYYIDFVFHEQSERINISNEEIVAPYEDKDPKEYQLKIEVTKGLWNVYWVQSYSVEKRNVP